jgi:uncharacterized protein YkwD
MSQPPARRTRTRGAVALVAVGCAAAVTLAPMTASAVGGLHSVKVRRYDTSLLSRVNATRIADSRHRFRMPTKLHSAAHAWAAHLASTGVLEHNPNLVAAVSRACPNWTSIGENVGVEAGTSSRRMFSAYMHSPPHRANILDRDYTVVGIATVSVTRNGRTTQWNVMDFANHCR